jgi:DNA gyrase/topoisomerase IV subunit A
MTQCRADRTAHAGSEPADQVEWNCGGHGDHHSTPQLDRDRGRNHHPVNNPGSQLADLLKFVQGPDFPTAGIIHGKAGILQPRMAVAAFMMRAKAAIETSIKTGRGHHCYRDSYQVNKSRLIERIAELVNNKDIEAISDIRDESDRDGMRIVVELKRAPSRRLCSTSFISTHKCRKASA